MTDSTGVTTAEMRAAFDAIMHRVGVTLDATGDAFPLYADPDTGRWETTRDGNWCAGHWINLLWLAATYADTPDKETSFERAARSHTETLESSGIRETMFGGMNFLYAGFRGWDLTGDRSLFGLGLEGADAMRSLFHEPTQLIPRKESGYAIAGPEYEPSNESIENDAGLSTKWEASSDSIYTCLPVLWRAYEEVGEPTFRDVALSHANRHVKWMIREDGKTWNRAVLDPETGEPVRWYNKHAYSDETCWARGHGWSIAGYAWAYAHTHADRFLTALEKTVEYYVDQSPDDLVPYWDFEAPGIPDEPRDTSAAALVAYGLNQLPDTPTRARDLKQTGMDILESLITEYLYTNPGDDRHGMILHGCYEKPSNTAVDHEHIWTDYYVAYTLHNLLQSGIAIQLVRGRKTSGRDAEKN
jgi:unsaturated chondroitin disaccharide hydrolase